MKSMKARELIREAERGGAVFVRSKGDHRLYRFPNGRTVAIPVGGKHTEASPGVIALVRRTLRQSARSR